MVTGDEAFVQAVREDWRTAAITDAERAMLIHVEKLTRTPAAMTREDVEALRDAGYDDTAILQIHTIAGFFAYVNRMADGLGVGRP